MSRANKGFSQRGNDSLAGSPWPGHVRVSITVSRGLIVRSYKYKHSIWLMAQFCLLLSPSCMQTCVQARLPVTFLKVNPQTGVNIQELSTPGSNSMTPSKLLAYWTSLSSISQRTKLITTSQGPMLSGQGGCHQGASFGLQGACVWGMRGGAGCPPSPPRGSSCLSCLPLASL